jgi:hypothetical protein
VSRAAEVLAELRALQLEVCANGDRLRLSGPTRRITPELRTRVLEAKPELLRLLGAAPVQSLGRGLAVAEVLQFPAGLLMQLPLPATLAALAPHAAAGPITIATHPACAPATFGAYEWLAMVVAAENDRAWPHNLAEWCERKRRVPSWQLTRAEALGAVFVEHAGWPVDRVLRQLGAHLQMVLLNSERDPGGGNR